MYQLGMVDRLGRIFSTWQRGAVLALIYGIAVMVVFATGGVVWWAGNSLLNAAGSGVSSDMAFRLWLWMVWLWLPLGLGFGAHYAPARSI